MSLVAAETSLYDECLVHLRKYVHLSVSAPNVEENLERAQSQTTSLWEEISFLFETLLCTRTHLILLVDVIVFD